MKVLIVGLGLIGGAYAYRLKNKGYTVYATDLNLESIEYAKEHSYIDAGSTNALDFINDVDMIILSIYPQAILEFLKKNAKYFKAVTNTIVSEILKQPISFQYASSEQLSRFFYNVLIDTFSLSYITNSMIALISLLSLLLNIEYAIIYNHSDL